MTAEVAVLCGDCSDPVLRTWAEQLALQLDLPLTYSHKMTGEYHLMLRVGEQGLELVKPADPHLNGPVRVDFTAGRAAFRRKQQKKELLLRAAGCKKGVALNVIDATGGLGRDSFLLAAAGCRVQVFEQQPVIAALLAEGLERAAAHPETAAIAGRIRLTVGDAVTALQAMQADEEGKGRTGKAVDVVYIDPMFPERKKSALVKKELQMLQMLAVPEAAPERLLAAALGTATNRVVVKRPLKAPFLTARSPSHSLAGKTVRFDVYMQPHVNWAD
ncbi:MAG: class I SAM-dependent methyltransferase [Candidatus Electrothrix sp. YB6]